MAEVTGKLHPIVLAKREGEDPPPIEIKLKLIELYNAWRDRTSDFCRNPRGLDINVKDGLLVVMYDEDDQRRPAGFVDADVP